VFVVFALGELYRQHARPKHELGVPGCTYFESAMELFEDLYEEPTIEYIETILLIVGSLLSFILCSFPWPSTYAHSQVSSSNFVAYLEYFHHNIQTPTNMEKLGVLRVRVKQ
jgi:hypothetical protein